VLGDIPAGNSCTFAGNRDRDPLLRMLEVDARQVFARTLDELEPVRGIDDFA
jgi:hypothetical protein